MSDWLPVIIIGFAIALVLGPVMWLKPNARDSRLADLRSRAAQAGITVQIQALPAALGDGTAAVYYQRWQNRKDLRVGWVLDKQRIDHELNFSGVWDWADGQPAPQEAWKYLRQMLETLPRDACAITATPVGLGIQWPESGGNQAFQKLMKSLDEYTPLIEEAIRKVSSHPASEELS
ncbi:hypothetical protein BTJ40_13965 [Microbulbifer sp. A4B17]|uniref:hypothetical protein n=1 Tax=Microbulbifer sp. A4B17 TaxID=359370 RepID=UPI000D52D97F|nr:hypothetical protein [Microbulbifer sp. A4B17]AWF81842.1 hypothetical protein BTJ40_13965 [Microbulbifer sp. A4B17]